MPRDIEIDEVHPGGIDIIKDTHFPTLKDTGGVAVEEAEKIIKAGHPPIANKVVLVDFDGTLYPFGRMFNYPAPIPGAVKFMRYLHEKGYRLGIFTSRLSKKWLRVENQDRDRHYKYIMELCRRDGMPYNFITAEKVPAEYYIDDKAIRFDNNWDEISERF